MKYYYEVQGYRVTWFDFHFRSHYKSFSQEEKAVSFATKKMNNGYSLVTVVQERCLINL